MIEENAAAGTGLDRPQLHRALEVVSSGEAHALVVSHLDRLAASLQDFAALVRWFEKAGGYLISLDDMEIDTSTADGSKLAQVIAAIGDWERRVHAARVREELAARRVRGQPISRPALIDQDPELHALITSLHAKGRSLQQIADVLNAVGMPTVRGGERWRPSSLQATLGKRRSRPTPSPSLPPQ